MGIENDGSNFRCVRTLQGHEASVVSVKFEPIKGTLLLSGSADQTVRLWRHETGECVFTSAEHEGGLNDVCWIGRGSHYFCTASDDKSVGIWDTETQKLLNKCTGHSNYVFSVKSNARGDMLVTGSFDETVRVWDVRTASSVREIPAHGDPVTSVDVSPDGSFIVSGSYDGLCRVWNVQDGRAMNTIVGDRCEPVSNVFFTPNGRFLLITTLNDRIILNKFISSGDAKKDVVRTYGGHVNHTLCLIPGLTHAHGTGGNRWLVSGSEDNSICVWNITKGKKGHNRQQMEDCCQRISGRANAETEGDGHCDVVLCVHGHPTAPTIATGGKGGDRSIKIWNDVLT